MNGCNFCLRQLPHYSESIKGLSKPVRFDGDWGKEHSLRLAIVQYVETFHLERDNGPKIIESSSNHIIDHIDMNYCPECGRKLIGK